MTYVRKRLKMRKILCILLVFGINLAHAYSMMQKEPIRSYLCSFCTNLSHDKLTAHWEGLITPGKPLNKLKNESRKYQITTTYKQLRSGVSFSTEAEGAVIRIMPAKPQKVIKKALFRVKNKLGMNLSLKDASNLYTENAALNETSFADNTLILAELNNGLGKGEFTLLSDADPTIKDNTLYNINIFDRNSMIQLGLETEKAEYFYGDQLKVRIQFHDEKQSYPLENLLVTLFDANGKKVPLTISPSDSNTMEATTILDASEISRGGIWYLVAQADAKVNKSTLRRRGHISFSYAIPSATIREIKQIDPNELAFQAEVDVATESRYALVAVLYGQNEEGQMTAIETTQTAEWLHQGENRVDFFFSAKLKTRYKEPFYVGYLRLIDYGQLKLVFSHDTPIELSQLAAS